MAIMFKRWHEKRPPGKTEDQKIPNTQKYLFTFFYNRLIIQLISIFRTIEYDSNETDKPEVRYAVKPTFYKLELKSISRGI